MNNMYIIAYDVVYICSISPRVRSISCTAISRVRFPGKRTIYIGNMPLQPIMSSTAPAPGLMSRPLKKCRIHIIIIYIYYYTRDHRVV